MPITAHSSATTSTHLGGACAEAPLEPRPGAGPKRARVVATAEKRVTLEGELSTRAVQDVLVSASAELSSAKPVVELRGTPKLVERKTVKTDSGYAVVEQVSVELLVTTMKEVTLLADVLSRCHLEGTALTLDTQEEPVEVTRSDEARPEADSDGGSR